MKIMEFKLEDANDCVEILNKNKKNMGDLHTEESLKKASSYNHYWVAKIGKKIIGLIGVADLENGIGMVASLSVDPDCQGKGIGQELLRTAKKFCKKNKFRKLLLLTHEKNKPMMILAIKEDFIPEGSLKRHFRDGRDVIYFSYFI